MRLPEPGRICMLVTPPSSAASNPGSCGQIACSAQAWGVTGSTISLPSLCALTPGLGYTPRWECTSINPGVTQRPFASITVAPAGAVSCVPTPAILPSTMSTSPLSMRVPVPVSTVAPRISVGVERGIVYVEANGAGVGEGALAVAGVASGVDVLDGGGVAHAPINIHKRGTTECLCVAIRFGVLPTKRRNLADRHTTRVLRDGRCVLRLDCKTERVRWHAITGSRQLLKLPRRARADRKS